MNSQQRRKQRRLEASQAVELNAAACHDSELKWLEASAEGEQKPLKTFSGIAYSGDAMDVGWGPPVVVDLSGMDTSKNVVALMDHDSSQRVGHITAIDVGANRKLKISGKISAAGDAAKTVVADASSGFPWQFSIGATVKRQEFVEAGQKVNVNGRALTGPLIVARQSTLREVSFVAVGADASTSASLAASASKGVREMEFSQWLAAKGIDESTLPEAASIALKASYESDKGARAKPDSVEVKASGEVVATEFKSMKESLTQLQAAIAEQSRIASINSLNIPADLKAKAIKDGLNADAAELQHLRASRPSGPAIHVAQHNVTGKVLEAAACQALGLKASEKHYDAQTLEAAHKEFKNRVSLGDILMQAAWSNGYSGRSLKQDIPGVLRAAFSTNDIGDVLSNTANKFALQTYMAVENSWRAISAVRNVQDFKTVTSYRLTGNLQFAKVGAGGKIENGELGNQSYTNSADTYAKMLSITRQDIINDDLGVLSAVPGMIGRGAALKQNEVFWTEFMNNSSFFAATHTTPANDTGNSNLATGSPASSLSVSGLTAAELLFFNQVDPNGKPLGVMPKILLVPNALNVTATQLMRDTEVRDTTASTKYTTGNPHAGKFNVVRSSYLSNTTITGYSTTAWYLLADPMDLPVIEMCFLNGQEVPVIEQAEADFNTLGIQMRGYNDFGVAKQDFRGGVKSAGA